MIAANRFEGGNVTDETHEPELDAQKGEILPDRELMSLVNPDFTDPLGGPVFLGPPDLGGTEPPDEQAP